MKNFIIIFLVIFLPFAFSNHIHAEDLLVNWRYSKLVNVKSTSNYKSVFLDDEVYLNSMPNLEDLRIVDDQGRFVSYYIVHADNKPSGPRVTQNMTWVSEYRLGEYTMMQYKVYPAKGQTEIKSNLLSFSLDDKTTVDEILIFGSFDNINWTYITTSSLYKLGAFSKTEVLFYDELLYPFYNVKFRTSQTCPIKGIKAIFDPTQTRQNTFTKNFSTNYQIENIDSITRIELLLPDTKQIRIKSVHVEFEGTYVREYTLTSKYLKPFTGRIYNFNINNVIIKNSDITLTEPIYSAPISLEFDNKDNQPPKVKSIKITYVTDKIVFQHQGSSSYRLLFGNPLAKKPVYDIEQFRTYIEGSQQIVGLLGPLADTTTDQDSDLTSVLIRLCLISPTVIISLRIISLRFRKRKIPFLHKYFSNSRHM